MTATATRIMIRKETFEIVGPDLLGELQADAAGADDADDGRRAGVRFEEIEHLPGDDRQYLRQQAETDLLQAVPPLRQHRFDVPFLGRIRSPRKTACRARRYRRPRSPECPRTDRGRPR